MVEMAIADGITHIVVHTARQPSLFLRPRAQCHALCRIAGRGNKRFGEQITLGLGCDFHLMFDNIEDAQRHPTRYTINGHNYLLVEFPDSAISPNTPQTFYQLSLSGMTPIITHPERNPILARQPERMAEWLKAGALIQVTASSLTGRFGQAAEQAAIWLLDHQWVHFLATDAHNTQSRPPAAAAAFDWVAEQYDLATAERLCIANPRAAFYGEALERATGTSGASLR